MRVVKLLFIIPICIVCLLSCLSTAKEKRLYTDVTDKAKFILLPPSSIEKPMDMAQYLSAEFRGQNYFINSWIKADDNIIQMSLFNEMGASLMELNYREGAIHYSSTVIPAAAARLFKPEYIIADFQFCFFDPVLLGKALSDCGLVLEIKEGSRRILSGEDVIIEIIKTNNTVKLQNYLRGYTYTVTGDF